MHRRPLVRPAFAAALVPAILAVLVALAGCGEDEASMERFTSEMYGYEIVLDPVMRAPSPARTAWDGEARIDHGNQYVDELDLADGSFFFLYGAPVDSTLEEFARERHGRAVQDHRCETSPEVTDATLDGAAALRYDMECSGVHIQWLVAVHEGRGLVSAMGADLADRDANRAEFERLMSTVRWVG